MSNNAPGDEQYVPTRLEWLAVKLNSLFQYENPNEGLLLFYNAGTDGKSIDITVIYTPKTNKELMDNEINNAEHIVSIFKNAQGWQWIETNVIRHEKGVEELTRSD